MNNNQDQRNANARVDGSVDERFRFRVEDLDQRLKERIVQVKKEVGLEFADALKSLGLHMEPPSFSDVKGNVEEFNEGEV
ncbi:hypothetical protein F0562_024747 [Nyssa sinensis]|uniref:Uncharacterized protein n=1 Tax=Nyssa sinensis TaxID=561372 RepID=A0A5J5BCF2_9ASTE|nr:hypothetical protein F0562_024747 [Nyssa sinensis]